MATAEELFWKGVAAKKAGNHREADDFIRDAADMGYADAQYLVGLGELDFMDSRDEDDRDYRTAAMWFQKAALQGHEESKKELDQLIREGKVDASRYALPKPAPSSTSNIPKQQPTCEGQWTPATPPAPAPTVTGVKPISAFFGNWEYSGGQFKVNITEKEFTHKMEGKYFTFAIDSWTAVNNISPKTKTTYPTGYKITGKTKKQKGFDHYTGITALYVFIKNSWSLVWGKNADDIPSPEYRNDKRFGT